MANFHIDNGLEEYTIIEDKVRSMILTGLVDTILDHTRLSYDNDKLILDSLGDAAVMLLVKTFFTEEYDNRYDELRAEAEKKEQKASEELKEVVENV